MIVENTRFIFKEHHLEIIKKLEAVYRLEITRLIINIPPGYGKTELVVVLFCAWCFAKTKDCRFLHLSYTSDLTAGNSVKIKDIINTPEFQKLWPTEFSKEINGKEHWKTDQGEFRAKSTGGAVTGFRAGRMGDRDGEGGELSLEEIEEMMELEADWTESDEEIENDGDWMDQEPEEGEAAGTEESDGGFHGALIIDDPIKPEDAESDVLRKKMNKRMVSTLKSRIMHEDVPVILIMQRIHDEDPAGFMIGDPEKPEEPGGTGDVFEVLKIEAIRKDDQGKEYALWPRKDSLAYLQKYRLAAPYEFSSQYQQNPVPDDGIFFQKHQFNRYDFKDLPEGEDFGASDYATKDESGDFTEHGVFRVTEKGDIYIKDWYGMQETSDKWVDRQLDMAKYHGISMWGVETGPILSSVMPWLKRRMVERKIFIALKKFSHSEANKEENARGFQALVSSGRVYVPHGTTWAQPLIEQLCRFPKAKFDDKVDTCSIFAKMINQLWADGAVSKTTPELEKPETINDLIERHKRKSRNKRR